MRRWQIVILLVGVGVIIMSMNLLFRLTPSEERSIVLDAESQRRISQLKRDVEVLESQLKTDKRQHDQLKKLANDVDNSVIHRRPPPSQTTVKKSNHVDIHIPNVKLKPPEKKKTELPVQVKKEGMKVTSVAYPAGDCQFSAEPSGLKSDVRMLDVFDMISFDNVDGGVWKQGFDISYNLERWKDKPLKVFVIPHSHNDPGWLKTFHQYYGAQTRNILNNIVNGLSQDPSRRFIWAEISYFDLWWNEQSDEKKQLVKRLLENGQLEIVTGGWVMNDEANTHYFAMIDQMIEGHEWLKQNLGGVVPRSGWAIDPFGHSPTMAYLLSRMGFDFMLIQRVHYSVKKHLAEMKSLEFRWRQNWDHSSSTDMFCHMMPFYSYDIPHTCGPDPKVCCQFDFKRLPGGGVVCPWKIPPIAITDANVAERADVLLDQYRKKAELFKTNVLLVPLGDDFRYDKEVEVVRQYTHYGRLMSYINSHPELRAKVQFGTLNDYMKAVKEDVGSFSTFPTLSGDFYTYADREDHYWSGYFTTRPFFKLMDRLLESALRSAEILFSLATVASRVDGPSTFPVSELFSLMTSSRRDLGLFQHHDGITGTAKDPVVVDYGNRMLTAINNVRRVMIQSAQFLLAEDRNALQPQDIYLEMDETIPSFDSASIKKTIVLSSEPKRIYLYNSLEHQRIQAVCVVVSTMHAKVTDSSGNAVKCQINPIWLTRQAASANQYELCFIAQIPSFGISTYHVVEDQAASVYTTLATVTTYGTVKPTVEGFTSSHHELLAEISIKNDIISATFGSHQGLVNSVTRTSDGTVNVLNMKFVMYGTRGAKDKSGAYLFLPDGEAQPVDDVPDLVRVIQGSLIQRVTSFLPHVECEASIVNSPGLEAQSVHLRNLVDIRDLINREIAMRIQSSISNTNRVFYTDLNGFQIQRHQTLDKIPLQANVYPMPMMAFIQDRKTRLSLVSRQSLGFASLQLGWMEVILDRRLMQDDSRGLGQGIRDNKVTPLSFWLLVEQSHDEAANAAELRLPTSYPSLLSHLSSQQLLHPVSVLLPHDNAPQLKSTYSGILPLPCDIHLVNLRLLYQSVGSASSPTSALLLHRKGYDCHYPATEFTCSLTSGKISLREMFPLRIESAHDMSLSLLHDRGPVDLTNPLQLAAMELYTYQLKW